MLYLALLLHDTGKAANQRHHEDASAMLAQKVARRLQLSSERRRMLIMLVNSHYELSSSRTKPQSGRLGHHRGVRGHRGNLPILDALMLLTLADGMGTSDQNWSRLEGRTGAGRSTAAPGIISRAARPSAQYRENREDLLSEV